MKIKILRRPEVLQSLGYSRSTLQSRINEGLMPPPINLGDRAVGFLEHEIQATLESMAAGKNKKEIKILVDNLIDKRANLAGVSQ